MNKGFGYCSLNFQGFPIEIKNMKKNNFLGNDVLFGNIEKFVDKYEKPYYYGNEEIVELKVEVAQNKKKMKKKASNEQVEVVQPLQYKEIPLEEIIHPSENVMITVNNITKKNLKKNLRDVINKR